MNKPVTRIAICLDSSYSMHVIKSKVVRVFNAINAKIKAKASEGNQTKVSLYTFNRVVKPQFENKDASVLRHITEEEYRPGGDTAMLACIGQAARQLLQGSDITNDDEANIVMLYTDGGENCSSNWTEVESLINKLQSLGNWTFVFNVPPGHKSNICSRLGVPEGNVKEWNASDEGLDEVQQSTMSGLDSYYDARSRGIRSMDSFFVTADLSKVTEQDVRAMPDLSGKFREFKVEREEDIRPFVEERLGVGSYKIGCAYYELSKTEKVVQANKSVLVRKRGEKKVYGGKDGRRLIGLPEGAKAKVDIGNLGNFEVFVQSTSVNRKLVRGTTLLVDTTLTVELNPTWNHVKAEAEAKAKAEEVQKTPAKVPTKRAKKSSSQTVVVTSITQKIYRDKNGRFAKAI